MSTQHTPGPWWTTDHGIRDVGGYIAHTNSVQRYEGQDERYAFEIARRDADKRLIAAAPELLEALQNIAAQYNTVHGVGDLEMQSAIDFAYRAIAKATGGA